jgi:hypothetical protein
MAVFNSEWQKHKDKSPAERERIAFSSANGVAGPHTAKKFAKLLQKVTDEEVNELTAALLAAIEDEWQNVPLEIQPALTTASLSGVGQGMLQIDVSNAALIASANTIAEDYARERAAELVGMKRDVEGNLIENPDARWAISDTTRERIREIIADAFTAETPLSEVATEIQEALADETEGNGIFSMARAELIAQTEVSNSQIHGNVEVWRQSGVVKRVKWLTSQDEGVCSTCEENSDVEVEFLKPFPSGDLFPGAHPRCRCSIVVTQVSSQT